MTGKKTLPQPRPGERALGCAHQIPGSIRHWWQCPGMQFARPDGSVGTASWIVACATCAEVAEYDPFRLPLTRDFLWQPHPDDGPIIRPTQN